MIEYKDLTPTAEELRELIALSAAWAAEGSCYGYIANGAKDYENRRIFAACDGGRIVGYLLGKEIKAENRNSIMPDGAPCFEIEELYVIPELRSRGIGRALFAFAEEKAKTGGADYLLLTTATKDHASVMRFYVNKAGLTPWSATLYKDLAHPAAPAPSEEIRIIPYEDQYRDDMIFTVLSAKNALGRIPRLNEDLLDVKKNYLDKDDGFWLALGKNGRVAGCIGCSAEEGSGEAVLHRLYVRPEIKRRGIGSALLQTAELFLLSRGITAARVHLGEPKEMWFESYAFYLKHGYREYAPRCMRKEL